MLRETRHCSPPRRGARRDPARVRASRRAALLLLAACGAWAPPAPALAAAGSGSASIAPSAAVVAGANGTWTVTYIAAEDFASSGGMIEVRIPAGWTAPQKTSAASAGFVSWTNAAQVDSVTIAGFDIRVYLGAPPHPRFRTGDAVSVIYGSGGGPASARAQSSAPAIATFVVRSDPFLTGAPAPLASSPSLSVVTGPVSRVRVVDATLAPVGPLARTTDQDTTHLYLRGYDANDNPVRLVAGAWSLAGLVGGVSPASGVGTVVSLAQPGAGYAIGDSGSWADSTGLITVDHGAFASLAFGAPAAATAGAPFAATVEARDADGNRVTGGPGSSASIIFRAYVDSLSALPADPGLTSGAALLAGGFWSGTLTATRAGTYFLAARDTVTGIESARRRLAVAPSAPDRVALDPDTLRLTAGVPDTATVRVFDAFGNRSPVSAPEALTLWTDRPAGDFLDLSGNGIFEVTIGAGADSARFAFRDTQTTSTEGRVRAIDANGTPPFLGTAGVPVFTEPAAPAGAVSLAAIPDTLIADGADSARVVSAIIRDAYGNPVAAGERFTLTGALVTPVTDDDPGTSGAQLLADQTGVVRGWVRAGILRGAGSASIVSERGSASGVAPIALRSGVPAGAIAVVSTADSLAADSVATLSIQASGLADANGNPVEDGEAYTLSTTLGAIAASDQDPGSPGIQTLASGAAISFALFGGDALGTARVTATSVRGASSGFLDVRLVPGEVDAARSTLTASSPVAVGPPGSAVTVTLRDREDHAIPGVSAALVEVTLEGVPASVTALDPATDSAGAIRFEAASTVADTATARAVARGVLLGATADVTFLPGPLDHFDLSGPAGPLSAGGLETLHATARDAFGNALPARSGDALRPSVLAGGASLPDSVLLAGGEADLPFTPTAAAPLTIRVEDDSSHAATYGPVTVGPGPPYRVTALPASADTLAAGDSLSVEALAQDAFGNPAPGTAVDAAVVAGGGSVAPASAAAGALGRAAFTLRAGPLPGPLELRFFAPASAAPDSVRADTLRVVVRAAGAATVEISTPPGAAAGDTLAVLLTLRDAFGNVAVRATPSIWVRTTSPAPVPDHVAWFAGAGAAGALADSAASDGARYDFAPADSGRAALLVRDVRAETIRLRASGAGIPTAESGDVVVGAAAPAVIATLSGDGQTAVVDRELPQPLRVLVRDAFGNPAPGAGVAYRAVAGGGSVDVVRGGASDSVAATDAAGVAACEVARLGVSAGSGANVFRAGLMSLPAAEVFFTATALPDTLAALALAPAALSLAPGATSPVTVTGLDRFGNTVPAAPVTVYLGTPIAGSLESLGATSGGPGSQSGVTDAAGALSVRYRAPGSAPAADSILARGVTVGPVGIRASIGPGTAASIRLLPDTTLWTAGASVRVRVQALDAFGNAATGDTATIVMQPGGAVAWSPPWGPLVAGEFVTFGRDTVAETVSIAASRLGGGSATAGPIEVRPADPAGVVPIAATRDTLTADGRSASTVTLGPIRDAYGNLSPAGTLVLVSAGAASLLASDARTDLPGLDLATGADGTASLLLVAPSAPGADTLAAATRAGSATGRLAFTFTPPPTLAYEPGSLTPSVVVPGSSYAFALRVQNPGAGTIQLAPGTTLSFGSGATAFSASLASATAIAPGTTATLSFSASTVDPAHVPGAYAPALRAVGLDGTVEPFDFYPSLGGSQVSVTGLSVTPVSASPSPVPLGTADLTLLFDVHNLAGSPADLVGLSLVFSQGSFVPNGAPSPPLPATIQGGSTLRVSLSVRVPTGGITPGSTVDARLDATATFAGATVVAASASPVSFEVVSAARLAASPLGASPSRYLRGRTFAPRVRVRNLGASAVTLARDSTRLVLELGATRLSTGLQANAAVAAGDSADLVFDSLVVAAGVPRGSYGARLILRGTEAGQAFADSIGSSPDPVPVVDPALLTWVAGSLLPDTVSAGQTRPLALDVSNAGDVPFDFEEGTELRLGAPLNVTRTLGAPMRLDPAATVRLTFDGGPLGAPSAPGTAAATLGALGSEDGIPRAENLAAGSVVAVPPASLAYVNRTTAPAQIRSGTTVDFTTEVRNGGGSPFLLDPGASTLEITDGVERVLAPGSGAAFSLAPGATATLSFPGAAIPAALASQPYPVTLSLAGSEWSLPTTAQVVSADSEVVALEPLAAIQVVSLDAGTPVQVAPGAGVTRVWGLELTPLIPPGGSSLASLSAVRVTVLVNGTVAGSPGTALTTIALRDRSGALLAQALAGAVNPVPLTLASPRTLFGGADSVYLEVAVAPSTTASRIALRLASASDLVASDGLTGSAVPVRGGGGLPFAPLTSPDLTLFARAHGYPNPFRAGREAVRLSYVLRQDAPVRVTLYTLFGAVVRELSLPAGTQGGAVGLNEVPWDGTNGSGQLVRPGVYVARIEGGGVSEEIKIGVLR